MEVPHFLKIFSYMYHLNRRNFNVYNKPVLTPQNDAIVNNSIHWVGHATTVINLEGKILVTDPMIGNLGFIKRLVKPSLDLKEISIDYLLITHGHMDHLNNNALKDIDKNAIVIVPRGLKTRLKMKGFKNIIVLRPGESYKDSNIQLKCIKAEHKGNRYPGLGFKDCNSYFITRCDKSILLSADTAYTNAYNGIKADVAIMPVGNYKPDDFLKMHCSPEQSFDMFKMMDCNLMIPIHYKTYILAQDEDLETVAILNRINDGSIKIIEIGETVVLN